MSSEAGKAFQKVLKTSSCLGRFCMRASVKACLRMSVVELWREVGSYMSSGMKP